MTQQLSSKLGEVAFRKKLTDQHVGKKHHFEGEPDKSQIVQVLRERVTDSRRIFKDLAKRQINLSSFLEIGAEKGQRASLLASEFNANGIALDISLESLKSSKYFAKKLNLKRIPTLVCADAENLPFSDNSIPFVFAFQTLHHFPSPKKAILEMQRVSSESIYFSEEPVKQLLNLGLWKRDLNLNLVEKFLKLTLLLPFLSRLGGSEDEYSVLENEFAIGTWKKSLAQLKEAEITIEPVFWGPSSTFNNSRAWSINPITKLLTAIEGGGITVLSHHRGVPSRGKAHPGGELGLNALSCPLCKKGNLKRSSNQIVCPSCKSTYPIKSGVYIMLAPALRKKLYPQFK